MFPSQFYEIPPLKAEYNLSAMLLKFLLIAFDFLTHQSILDAPPSRATAGHLQILCCPGAGHLPTPGPTPSFQHARGFLSEYDYTEDFTGKTSRLTHLSRTVKNLRGLSRHVLDFVYAFLCWAQLELTDTLFLNISTVCGS